MDFENFLNGIPRVMRKPRKKRKRLFRKLGGHKKGPDMDQKYFAMKHYHTPRKWDDGMSKKGKITEMVETNGNGNKEFFLASTSLNDHYITDMVDRRTEAGLPTITTKEELVVGKREWNNFVVSNYKGKQIIQFSDSYGMVIDGLNFVDYSAHGSTVDITLCGDADFVESEYKKITSIHPVAKCHIEWVYGPDGSSVNIPMTDEKTPITEMYPFLKDETIHEYYDRFLESSASILLLIGPPGTGKTTFIRGLLNYTQSNAIVTYDEKILNNDYIFARFIEDDSGVMVIEDADNFLKSRSDGNSMMHRFLNVGDGLISMKNKKMIFSTNLPSISDVDPALVRPGRCFDVVTFENYTVEQAKILAEKLRIEFEPEDGKKTYSLAEIFHKQNNTNPKQIRKMGFY